MLISLFLNISLPDLSCRSAASQGIVNGTITNHAPEDLILLPDVNEVERSFYLHMLDLSFS
jgi:hypothetical protein